MNRHPTALKVIEVREQCNADWAAMVGDRKAKFCGHCHKTVHNLSAMPTVDAERLICESGGDLCVRFLRNNDGTPFTLDYEKKTKRRGWKRWTLVGIAGAMLAAAAQAFF